MTLQTTKGLKSKAKEIILWIIVIASAIGLSLQFIVDNWPSTKETKTKPDTTLIINPKIK